jgi:hypothetical protein
MIKKGNFSGDAKLAFKQGETAFKSNQKGLYNGDLNELWAEIVALNEGEIKAPKNKVEKAPQTK